MKKILLGCLAIVATMALWAFTQPAEKTAPKLTPIWFYYDGTGDPNDQSNYSTTPPPGGCEGADVHCAILAEPDGNNPGVPDQDDVNVASAASENFTEEEPGLVDFKGL